VLKLWVPLFDPFSASIDKVDQWVRIPYLPFEFWDTQTLSDLLTPIGVVTHIDQNTLLRLKGEFIQVCVNIDIT